MSCAKLLGKFKKQIKDTPASEGGGSTLPDGHYLSVVTKAEVTEAKESQSKFITFMVKVLDGESKGSSARLSQNIIKKDETLNEIGVSIVKGIFKQMFPSVKPLALDDTANWDKFLNDSIGYRMKFTVKSKAGSEYADQRIVGVMPPADAEDNEADARAKADQLESEDDETEVEEDGDKAPSLADVKKHLKALDRAGLIAFRADNEALAEVKWKKSDSDDAVRKLLLAALAPPADASDEDDEE